MARQAKQDPSEPRPVKVEEKYWSGLDFCPYDDQSLDSLVKELTDEKARLEELGAIEGSAMVHCRPRYDYYSCSNCDGPSGYDFTLTYQRLETEKEVQKRLAKAEKQRIANAKNREKAKIAREAKKAEEAEKERQLYEKLKEKYETGA